MAYAAADFLLMVHRDGDNENHHEDEGGDPIEALRFALAEKCNLNFSRFLSDMDGLRRLLRRHLLLAHFDRLQVITAPSACRTIEGKTFVI